MRAMINPEYVERVCLLAQWLGRFTMGTGIEKGSKAPKLCLPVLEQVVWPMVRRSKECHVYNRDKESLSRFAPILNPRARKWTVNVRAACDERWLEFWASAKGTVLFLLEMDDALTSRVLSQLYDPMIITNLSAYLDRAAVRHARKSVEANQDLVGVGLAYEAGVPNVTLFGSEFQTRQLIGKAFDVGRFTSYFLNLSSRPLAPLRDEVRELPQLREMFEREFGQPPSDA